MTLAELEEEISIELELMGAIVREAISLLNDLEGREPTVRERTAAGAFLAQFYGGIENILKRVHRYHNIPMPSGDSWHAQVFKRYCAPSFPPLPVLFDEQLSTDLAPYRKFRHVVYHGYGFQFDWERMQGGLSAIDNVFGRFTAAITDYVADIKNKISIDRGF